MHHSNGSALGLIMRKAIIRRPYLENIYLKKSVKNDTKNRKVIGAGATKVSICRATFQPKLKQ